MFKFIKRALGSSPDFKGGVLPDERSKKEKQKDFERKEIAKSKTVEWKEKSIDELRRFPTFNQDGSGSCVSQALSKALGIENFLEEGKFVHFSARDLYSRRENDGPGMYTMKALKDLTKNGITLEQLMPSQNMSEEEMNNDDDRKLSDKIVAQIYKPKEKYYIAVSSDPDSIAEVLDEGHGVIMTVKFKRGEWDKKVPTIGTGYGDWNYHKVIAVDRLLYKGKKAIFIEDSWGKDKGFNGGRIIMPEWFGQGRIYSCHYLESLPNDWFLKKDEDEDDERPTYQFNRDVVYGENNDEVAKVQKALKYEGFFPKGTDCTGYYGGITRKAVKEFQFHYEVAPIAELEAVDGFRVGPSTRAKLNELFA